ncbi:MAG TPA: IPT/TIG domain-containing protein [Terriglobales bacterium]|nr:IPT/TIG domain-containing protein [Terriglobales bacterium]
MMRTRLSTRFHKLVAGLSLFALLLLAPAGLLARGIEAAFAGVELTVPNETVPPGGMLQLKVQITEPTPISKGGQKATFSSTFLGAVQGIALFSPAGDASGTALLSNGSAHFSLHSPIFDMGSNIDYPIVTIAMPVKATAIPGATVPLTLDPSFSEWADPTGQLYPVLLTNGSVTVGGTLSISNLVPGGGVVPAGTKIAVFGMGFRPNSKVNVNEALVATKTYVSSNEIDITLTTAVNMTSRRIRVTKPSTNEVTTYYSYQRTTPAGKSANPLIAATVPLFAQSKWTVAHFRPVLNVSRFTGVALQNEAAVASNVRLTLFAANGTVLAAHSLTIQPSKRFSRDLRELFLGVVPATGTKLKVKVTSGPPIQVLGLLGDSVLRTVDPVDPSPLP